jgi:hypothetical protein
MKIRIHIIITFLFIFMSFSVFATKKLDSLGNKKLNHSLAFNVSDPLFKIFTKNRLDTSAFTSVAPIMYYTQQFGKLKIRLGLGGSIKNSFSESELKDDKNKVGNYKLNGLLSFYFQKNISPKWSVNYGINIVGNYHSSSTVFDSGFDLTNFYTRTWGAGAGPGILFQYHISRRMSLFSEYMLIYQYYNSTTGKKFSAFPAENYATQKNQNLQLQFEYPIAIFLNYNF